MRRQILWRLLFPGAFILAVAWAVAQVDVDQQRFASIATVAFYAIIAAGLLFAWRFRRSRLALCLAALAIAHQLLSRVGISDLGIEGHGQLTRTLVGVLLPLNLLVIAWSRDRGLFTWGTLWRLSLLPLQVPACAIACAGVRRQACVLMQRPFVPVSLPGDGVLSHAALTAFVIALAVLLLKATRHGDRMDAALLWTLTAVLVGLARTRPEVTTLYMAAGGLILVTSAVEEFFRMAYHDGLTGLPSRRALDEALVRLGTTYAVAMIDIDRFKSINDRHGHEAGDQVLRMVASRILRIGGRTRAFRYGGDEFAVIFPGRGKREAVPALQHLRRGVASSAFYVRRRRRVVGRAAKSRRGRTGRRSLRVRLSIGVAERTERCRNPEDVLRAADEALYRAKRAGRNRVAT